MYMVLALGLTRHPNEGPGSILRFQQLQIPGCKKGYELVGWVGDGRLEEEAAALIEATRCSVVQSTGLAGQAYSGHGRILPALMTMTPMTTTMAIVIHRSCMVAAGAHCPRHFIGAAPVLLACLTPVSDLQRATSQECRLQGHSSLLLPHGCPESLSCFSKLSSSSSFGTRWSGEGP